MSNGFEIKLSINCNSKIYYKITAFSTALKIAGHFENPDYIVI